MNNRLITAMVLSLFATNAFAAGGGAMPWDAAITAFVANVTGPVAGGIAVAAIAIAGMALIFGGELNAFGRTFFFILLVVGVIMGAAQILALFGAGGAVIPALPIDATTVIGPQ